MSYEDENNDQDGPAVWADAPQPVPPAMRTFKVVVERIYLEDKETYYVDAHSVTCDGDAAHFYVYRTTQTAQGPGLVAYASRVVRPYLDVEDVSAVMATTSKTMN